MIPSNNSKEEEDRVNWLLLSRVSTSSPSLSRQKTAINKREYESTHSDDDQRHAVAAEALSSANFRFIEILGRRSQMLMKDSQSLASKAIGTLLIPVSSLISGSMHGYAGEICALIFLKSQKEVSVYDNGGFSDLTGNGYSEGAIDQRMGYVVDDILDTILEGQFKLVMDKGTLDAIGLHPDDPVKRVMYWWDSVSKLVAPGGMLVIASLTLGTPNSKIVKHETTLRDSGPNSKTHPRK
ncbi:hypothetical protein IGI04_005904 [Brassica rapa subsp. trilocularis]|uniref:Methyltransferase n=1 Tax=Brassica rapa subsp. trilocularis TaxID=1813537 RepID=A0ABQ7NHP6_BRACM|nr:hypothetical protein IGI04_005904 [Brassica rapa subsp. trilocularis]